MNPTWLGGVGIFGCILIPIKWGGCSSLVDNPPVKVNISPKQIIRIYDEFFMVDGKNYFFWRPSMFQSKTMRMWKWLIHLRSSNKVPKWWSWANKRSWSCSSKFSPRPGRANEMYTPQSKDLLHLVSGIFLSSGKCCPGPAGPGMGHTPALPGGLWSACDVVPRYASAGFRLSDSPPRLPVRFCLAGPLTSQQSLQPSRLFRRFKIAYRPTYIKLDHHCRPSNLRRVT